MKLFILILLFISKLFSQDVEIIESKYYQDSKNNFSIKNVYENKDKFLNLDYKNATFGLSNDTFWIYVKVKNTTQKNSSNVIEFPYALLDYIHILEYKDSIIIDEYLTGDLTKFNTRKIDDTSFVFPYELKADETKEFIFKINSQGALNAGMGFYSKDEYYTKRKSGDLILGSYYGAVFIMLLYNMVLYLMIKEKVYLDYVVFHFSYLFLQLGINGYAFSFFWQDHPDINIYFLPLMLVFANYFSIVFGLSFLELKKYKPKLYYYFKILMMLYLLIFFSIFFISYSLALKLVIALSIVSVSSLFITAIYIYYTFRTISSMFFVVAWSAILIGALLTELQNLGILSMNPLIFYSSQIGAFIDLALLSFALAYRYNGIFNKLTEKESEVRILNSSLQEKVNLQTKNLKLLIKELNHRVKNNFQVILTFLWAQKRSIKDEESIKALDQTTKRIYAISSLHELLDTSDNISININNYIKEIINSFKNDDNNIIYNLNVENITLKYDVTVAIGLILNELLTNSAKYAFEFTKEPCIEVEFTKDKEDYVFKYSDNGVGLDTSNLINSSGLGYDLIHEFAHKLGKEKLFMSSNNGMKLILKISKKSIDEN